MTTPDCPDGCAIRDEATARADYILHTRTELDRVRAERDQLAAAVKRLDTQWVRFQENNIHNACEGHALCDLIASIEHLQRSLDPTPDAAA